MEISLKNEFLFQDLYIKKGKSILKSTVIPLSCYVCKQELNGISLTAKNINGETVFLCSRHLQAEPYKIAFKKE
jgi:hypothetical protein